MVLRRLRLLGEQFSDFFHFEIIALNKFTAEGAQKVKKRRFSKGKRTVNRSQSFANYPEVFDEVYADTTILKRFIIKA